MQIGNGYVHKIAFIFKLKHLFHYFTNDDQSNCYDSAVSFTIKGEYYNFWLCTWYGCLMCVHVHVITEEELSKSDVVTVLQRCITVDRITGF